MKFNIGDCFRVKSNGLTGMVVGTRMDIVAGKHAVEYYKVQWDHLSRYQEYPIDDTDAADVWELVGPVATTVTYQAPQTFNFIPITIDLADPIDWPGYKQTKESSPGCAHEFVDYYGFRENYKYCKKCDQKQKD